MYVTRPLSLLRKSPELLSSAPREGPNSGYLVLFDEDCETTTCFGLCKDTRIRNLPLPQNKDLTVTHTTNNGEHSNTHYDYVVFIPVLDQPLSSNRYYVIQRQGKHKGEASACSTKDGMGTCCCCTYIKDVKPRPLDPLDIYQQVEIIKKKHRGFTAKSVAEDSFPPVFLRRKYWQLYMRTPRNYQLEEAPGLKSSLRAQLPNLDFSSSSTSSDTVVVGKWYCPVMFVKELGVIKLKEQMKKSVFYEMTLEQRWDKIFGCDNVGTNMRVVCVDVLVNKEEACVDGKEAICDWRHVDDGVIWFKTSSDGVEGDDQSRRLLGLSALIMNRMKWEEERVGFDVDEFESRVNVKRTEEFDGKDINKWSKFGCYVLVERFVLKRVDGTVLLTHDFKHTNQIRSKWE
ncbi:hypothetical protein PanWU01x14_266160 [Parasponia andersonii]|uniref:Uncharacterized protein n=1 Tax=Parasponia andersonii TaxID=3476 RepID=A0A2P5B6Z1_PARAD|nr:hypothetical protein PanWU01x14_266160 [Parasponia andersonii]